jgi:hypothetical protein
VRVGTLSLLTPISSTSTSKTQSTSALRFAASMMRSKA